jgi:hypothetical protein
VVQQAAGLVGLDRLSAVFKPGQTALGHRWILSDGDDHEVGRTKLFYVGAGKTVGRLMRVTALSTSGSIHAKVLAANGAELFAVHSVPGKERHVDVEDAGGTRIGVGRRRELSLELLGPDGETVLAVVKRQDKEDVAFPIETAGGERLGALTKRRLEVYSPSISEMLFSPDLASDAIAFQATMHLGFAGSREYHLFLDRHPGEEPLRTLVGLAPVIAAYAY